MKCQILFSWKKKKKKKKKKNKNNISNCRLLIFFIQHFSVKYQTENCKVVLPKIV